MAHEPEEHVFLYYRAPDAIRGQEFPHRMRGLDEDEVYEYLDLLADQVQSTEIERAEMRTELQRLRAENDRLRDLEPAAASTSDAEALFSQAQEVADQVVEEAVRQARDLLESARREERAILDAARLAREAAELTPLGPAAGWSHDVWTAPATAPPTATAAPLAEVEYVRTLARVAQGQLRAFVEDLAEQVDRLGELPTLSETSRPH